MITGCSSGAACAFNVAWNTEEFTRVYSSCGSLTGLRGSFTNSTLVHKFEPKPIRFYFQSGSHDMWTSFGDWWSANQAIFKLEMNKVILALNVDMRTFIMTTTSPFSVYMCGGGKGCTDTLYLI